MPDHKDMKKAKFDRVSVTLKIVKVKKLFILCLSVYLTSSCKMQDIYMNVLEPAPVNIPSNIKNAGIIDRSEPTDATKKYDAVEKAVTLEGSKLDSEGTAASIAGLTDELSKNDRFSEIKTLTEVKVKSQGMGLFPPPLDWETVSAICRDNNVDALFSLELFDTDTKISYQLKKSTGSTLLGAITGYEQQADMLTTVKTGWRIYDPAGKNILDEIAITKDLTFSSTGLTPAIAAKALMDRKEAVRQVGNNAGIAFAQRILPYQIRVTREYYVKGTNNFKIAMRKARTGNWDEAGELWMKETTNSSSRIAGRACFNMAIISEIKGSLDVAIEWARKSYEDYNNKQGLNYINILKNRKIASESIQ
jgi:hypothetical protein